MKRITSTIAGIATVTGLAVAPLALSAPAQADTPTCASKPEFNKVQKGWSITRVRNLFDVPGKQVSFISGDAYSNASPKSAGKTAKLYTIKDGVKKVVAKAVLDSNGDYRFTVADKNGTHRTKYIAKVAKVWTNKKSVR